MSLACASPAPPLPHLLPPRRTSPWLQLRPHEDDTLLAVNIALSDEHEGGGTWVQALGGGGAGGPHEDAVSAGPLHTDETAAPAPFLPTLGPAARGARRAARPPPA